MNVKKKTVKQISALMLAMLISTTSLMPSFGNVVYAADAVSSSSAASSVVSVDAGSAVSAESGASHEADSSVAAPTPAPSSADTSSSSTATSVAPESTASSATSSAESTSSSAASSKAASAADGFVPLAMVTPDAGDTVSANVGDEVTITAPMNRDDIAVTFQWQVMQALSEGVTNTKAVYDYPAGAPTKYDFVWDDTAESVYLAKNPDAKWPGIELYNAIVDALNDIGADSSNVSVAWSTQNFALEGYTIRAVKTGETVQLFADLDANHYVGNLNADGKWEFTAISADALPTATWVDIAGANTNSYTFTVKDTDYEASYRCVVTVTDEAYKAQCLAILKEQGETVPEEKLNAEQVLYSVNTKIVPVEEETTLNTNTFFSGPLSFSRMMLFMAPAPSGPALSDDVQWITGLNGSYEYITKDTYDRVTKWLNEGKITQKQANRYWTWLQPSGFANATTANVLDENGFPVGGEGNTRLYYGFDLTNGSLEVNSDWYGKTVYFRVAGSQSWNNTGTSIKVPAYTELTKDAEGNYIEGASGTRYKRAITMLNPFVIDTGSKYQQYMEGSTVTTGSSYTNGAGWLLDENGNPTDMHVKVYAIGCERFNADPQCYMIDAEGNYRMDSVAWGVCTADEPDLSGKAYWVLKDYLANGYGFMSGHDTMYSYSGAYYDSFGVDLDESTIDPNDGTTWYYNLNTYLPTAHDPAGNVSNSRGGHYYMNELMGSNAGNVYSGTVSPNDAVSGILSAGGASGRYTKDILYGGNTLYVKQRGYTAEQAKSNAKYRTPTNFPLDVPSVFSASPTHTNEQVAFGPLWVAYGDTNLYGAEYGYYMNPMSFVVDGKTGTNNFYLTGTGNYLMNQIGHLPANSATTGEAWLLANSIYYISQRKQCEICAADQNGQETVHFVIRINSANANTILTALRNGGTYWYPLNGCYQLTDDITLPEDWASIKNFSGHWNSDVYKVTLNSKGTPLLANDKADGEKGWNLGTDLSKGTQNVFDANMNRTTGVSRVVGDLNDLFNTATSYAGYTVKILGKDNPKYMGAAEVYSCKVNTDSKYVISNLPCVYDKDTKVGVLTARVYDQAGNEVTEYGSIHVNVAKEFWDNDMTIPLYLGSFSASPVKDYVTYESAQGIFWAEGSSDDNVTVNRWEYRKPGDSVWQTVPESWDRTITNTVYAPGQTAGTADSYTVVSKLSLNSVDPAWNGYQFRAVFTSDSHGEWNSYSYYWSGSHSSNDNFAGAKEKVVYKDGLEGTLEVKLWPAYAEQGDNQTVLEGTSTTFRAYGYALADGTAVSVKWQYSTHDYTTSEGKEVLAWHDIDADGEYGGIQTVVTGSPAKNIRPELDYALQTVASDNDLELFHQKAGFTGVETKLTVNKVDIDQNGTHFRAYFTATTSHGTKYAWASSIADNWKDGSWTTGDGTLGSYKRVAAQNYANIMTVKAPELQLVSTKSVNFTDGMLNEDLMTPDEYGQTLLLRSVDATVCDGTAAYQAVLYYKPEGLTPVPAWQYMTYTNHTAQAWDTAAANALGYNGVTVTVNNSAPVDATYNGEGGWKAITSTMYISGAPISMYNPEAMLKYYFRCVGTTSYETVRRVKNLASTDKWGGLSMDYAIAIRHNGVIGYGQKNTINGSTVTDFTGIGTATENHDYSDWYYPNLSIKVPNNHHMNTAIVSFDSAAGYDSKDSLIIDGDNLAKLGITVSSSTSNRAVLISTTKDTVEKATWETALRTYVGFRAYDKATYSYDTVVNGTTGGGAIKWVVDEARFAGTTIDPASGHIYKIVDFGAVTSWESAKQRANSLDSELGMTGYLAEISTAEENTAVHNLLGNRNAWLGAYSNKGTWTWSNSGTTVGYTNTNGSTSLAGNNMFMQGDGVWNTAPLTSTAEKTWDSGWTAEAGGPLLKKASYSTAVINIPSEVANPHKLRITLNGRSSCYNGDVFMYPAYLVNGSWQSPSWEKWCVVNGTGYCTWPFDVPAGATAVKGIIYNNASSVDYTGYVSCYLSVTTTVTTTYNPVTAAVIEYEPQSLALAATNHSASDMSVVGTNAKTEEPVVSDKIVAAVIKGNTKTYDGFAIEPSSFLVSGSNGAAANLFKLTITAPDPNNYADYTTRVINGENYKDTQAVNATRYHVVAELTPEAIAAGWKLDNTNCQLECDLVITPRTVNVFSYHNDKEYDKTSAGVIKNITAEAKTNGTGVIAGDTVKFNTTAAFGYYTDAEGKKTVNNSQTNNGGAEYVMYRDASLGDLYIVHDVTSDPHHNYVLGTENYTGAINPRPVVVHSRYLDDPDKPRNVKAYDGSAAATISNILVDNVIKGDDIGLKDQTMSGTYATANAGETLTADGKAQPDRLKKLSENTITASKGAELTGNGKGNYYIAEEIYTGAISRAALTAQVSSASIPYGVGVEKAPWHDTVPYKVNTAATSGTWLKLDGLKGSDTLALDYGKSNFKVLDVTTPDMQFTASTPVGEYGLTYVGLNETNYPVLSNYIVNVMDGLVNVTQREILVTVGNAEKMTGDENPTFNSSFSLKNTDDTYTALGSDKDTAYGDMKLLATDTVANTILVTEKGAAATTAISATNGTSNIGYATDAAKESPARYLDLTDTHTYECEFCEKYYGFKDGTDHWKLAGYEVRVNQNPENGNVLSVASVTNAKGETVQNYKLTYAPGELLIHPELRFQLKATVPMYVCMYGYRGDGEIVEPTNYGITNQSNGAIMVSDISVSNKDGWVINNDVANLKRGEVSLQMKDTTLEYGSNTPTNPHEWIVGKSTTSDGTKMLIPMTSYMAGGNVNDAGEFYLAKVTFTVAEYGKTLPVIAGVTLPETQDGEVVNP